jgi:2-polyprenyl-6-methoxyphenol hydroxylase-like FAD-dependent oxidoreductase
MAFETFEIASCTGGSLRGGMRLGEVSPEATGNNLIAHRADLHRALLEALPGGAVETGREAVGFEEDGAGVRLRFREGPPADGRALVGADGLHSPTRRQLHGEERAPLLRADVLPRRSPPSPRPSPACYGRCRGRAAAWASAPSTPGGSTGGPP